jgi:tRNA isopentenyl-2-thiomethyl-A-37 hydroxylase MiaE
MNEEPPPAAAESVSDPAGSGPTHQPIADPAEPWAEQAPYREGAVDLLGILACGALAAFDRLAEDARLAPELVDRVHMTTMAAQQVAHFERVRAHLAAQDVDVISAMAPFQAAFTAFHTYTRPKDWLEGLLKAYVGDGIAADFYREVAAFVDADTRRLVHEVLADAGHADFVVEKVRTAIESDPKVAGRLALWGRRLVGEALSQAQRVAADRDSLTSLLTGTVDRPGLDLAAISRMFSRLIENHTRRMRILGLQS